VAAGNGCAVSIMLSAAGTVRFKHSKPVSNP
jgi:hypothetical protein